MTETNVQYRNSLFCEYFSEPIRLLSLCNAVLGTNYDDPTELEITTLEGIFFDERKNDISCKIRDKILVFIEHQSSVNLNMPFRFFSYAVEVFNKLVKDKRQIYRKKMIKFPAPRFFVLYDGDEDDPLEKIMRLSDAFNDENFGLELTVTSFNINFAFKSPLLEKCSYLYGYSKLVGSVKEGLAQGLSRREAITRAVDFCIKEGIMAGYLKDHSQEVFSMMNLEWDINEAQKAWREDGFDEGKLEGKAEVAANLIRFGMKFEDIHTATGLSIAQIKELAAQIKNA